MTDITQLRPIRPEEVATLRELAAADNHEVIAPTHVAVKGGKIIGYAGMVHRLSLVNVWMSTTAASALDSLTGLSCAQAVCAEHGSQGMVFPCAEDSPFYAKMEKLGFRRLGTSSVNVKSL